MVLRFPEDMNECVYFTRRTVDAGKGYEGHVIVSVFREHCIKCGKGLMGKPRDAKGNVMIRANEYVCPECGYSVEKKEYEDSLTANIQYTCPSCGNKGEKQIPFKRKKIKGIDILQFACDKCNAKIDVTKKMKEKKEDSK